MNRAPQTRAAAALALALAVLPSARSEDPPGGATAPKWEAGLFLGAARLPLYRGADEYKAYALPVPYFIYRGDVIQSDREGVRGVLFRTLRFDSTVSVSGHPPVDDDDGARAGMPELQPLVETGPALKWWPAGRLDDTTLYVQLAARATASADVDDDFGLAYEGWLGECSLVASRALAGTPWRYGGRFSLYWGSRDFHRYFYDVPDRFARDDRPAYDAETGYGGTGLSAFLTRRVRDDLTVGLYGRWDRVAGAVFEDSPLVRERDNFTLGCAVIWRFAESSIRVAREPEP